MSAWDEQPEHQSEIADLETTRLALRGAIQSVRNLQDINGKLKGEVQDFLHREKALNERLIRLQGELNDSYARLDAETAHDREREAATREALRQEIIAEQNHKWQSEIDALRQSVQNWTEVRRQKETELKLLKETLLAKEQEVFTLQKEKITTEENAHRDILETIKRSREGVASAVEQAIITKEKEIADLQRKLAAQPKIFEERMQQIEQDLHRKEQSLLLQFRDRQQSLELDWAHREKELWEKATEAREALEHELKTQWEDRRKTLEESVQKRRTALEIQAQQHYEEQQRRGLTRDEELHKTWAAKEASLAQEWASREKEMARQFQATLDQERLRASEQATQLKTETDLWRKNNEETLHRKEDEFNKAYTENEQRLRGAYRKKEEDLLAKHQEALTLAQHQISELMTRTSEKEGVAKTAQDRLLAAVKERDAMADRLNRLEADAAARHAELEALVKQRDEELARLNKAFTTRDEERVGEIQQLSRDQLHQDSELKVVREKIQQAESDRKTALDHAVQLENEFTQRRQQLEEAFRKETETLGERLAASSHNAAERQQTDQRQIAEFVAQAQQRAAEIQGLTHQLQLARHDIEKLTQESSDKQTKQVAIRRQMEERLVVREAELARQIETLEKERMLIEERLDARVNELEQELARRLSEERTLQERLKQSEEFRTDYEKETETLRDRLAAHEKQALAREDETRQTRETLEKERIQAEQKLQSRIGELEAQLVKQEGVTLDLQQQLARALTDHAEELTTAQSREERLQAREQTLEGQLKSQQDEIQARMSAVQLEHGRIEATLRQQLQEQDAAHMKTREQILNQMAEVEGELRRRDLEVKGLKDQIAQDERTRLAKLRENQQRETALEERVQFLYKSLEAQKAEHESHVETTNHTYMKEQETLRAQALQLETDLGRKTLEAADLLARLTQAQELTQELRNSIAQLEARITDREQTLRNAAQTHVDSEHKLEVAITDLKNALQKREVELQAATKMLQSAQRDHQVELSTAATREKQLEERAQSLDEKLRAQKDQITMRLSGVERQRLQSEEALHMRTLDLEQRLAGKTGLVKTLQDQLNRAGADQEHLEKKMVSIESHLARADQQLKARETEFQTLKSATQKELATTQETHQRKLLELQGQRLTLETELKGLQDALAQFEEEKKHLASLLKERATLVETQQAKAVEQEKALAEKTNALQALEQRLTLTEEQRADREQLAALLQKEIHELQLTQAAQQEEFRSRMAGFEKERVQLQETQQNRITQLESQLHYRESALRSLEEKMALTLADHEAVLSAATERESVLAEKNKSLESALSAQIKEWQTRLEVQLADRTQAETELHSRVVLLQETLALREKELVTLKDTLTQTERTQEALSASAQESIELSAKERQTLEERVLNETGRVRDLESQLRGHAVHIKEMEKSLATGVKEREALQSTLNELARRMEEETAALEIAHSDKARLLENKLEAVEHEWRERLESAAKTSTARVDLLQGKVIELEGALGVRENELSTLRQEMAEVSIERERLVDLVSEKDREHNLLAETAARDKEEFVKRLAFVQSGRKAAEETLDAQLKVMREELEKKWLSERQRAQGLDTQLSAQISELRQLRAALTEAKEERERLLAALSAEREKASAELRGKDQTSSALESGLRKQLAQQNDDFKSRLEATEKEAARQLLQVQARANDLEKALVQQRADAESRLAATNNEHTQALDKLETRLSQDYAAREKELHARLLELRDDVSARKADIQKLTLQLKDAEQARDVLDHLSTDSHAAQTQKREALEKELSKKIKAEKELQIQVADLETQLARNRADLEATQTHLSAEMQERQALEALAAQQKKDFEMQLQALGAERKTSESALHARLLELRDVVSARAADIERLQTQLKETEQARAALDHYSTSAHADATQKQGQLEEELANQSKRAQTAETQLAAQVSELKRLQQALEQTRKEREQVLATLAQAREKAATQDMASRMQLQMQENEFNARLAVAEQDTEERLVALQSKTMELEKAFAAERATFEERLAFAQVERQQLEKTLQSKISDIHAQWLTRGAELHSLEQQLTTVQKERDALSASSSSQHKAFAQQLEALRQRSRELERLAGEKQSALSHLQEAMKELETHRAHAQEQWEKETQERRAAQEAIAQVQKDFAAQLDHVNAGHAATEDDLRQRLNAVRAELDERFHTEQDKNQQLTTQLAAQVSELKQLHASLEETHLEREALLATLAGEREKASHDYKERDTLTAEQKRAYEQRLSEQEKEFHARLAASEKEMDRRLAAIQTRTVELEKALAGQRAEFEQRMAAAQSERSQAEKALQAKVSDIHGQWMARSAELSALEQQLASLQKERDALAASSSVQSKTLTAQLEALRLRTRELERVAAEKQSTVDHLQEALKELEAQRAHAQAQWESEVQERRLLQGAAQDSRAEFDRQLADGEAAHKATEDELHSRLTLVRAGLEERLNAERDKNQNLSTQLAAQLSELKQLRASLDDGRSERAALLNSLAAEREKAALEFKERDTTTTEQKRKYEQRLAALEKEFRDRLAAADAEATQRLEALSQQAQAFERRAAEKHAAVEHLQDAMKELEAHRAQAQEQLEKEIQERRLVQDAALTARQEFAQQLAAIQAAHQTTEEELRVRLGVVRAELDERINTEHDKNQHLSTKLTAQTSELKQLRASLEEVRQERESLLAALSAEREKSALEFKDRETLSTDQKRKYEQRLAAQEKEFRERLVAADAEAMRRLQLLQARTTELEKTLADQHSVHERQMAAQRAEYEQRLALMQAEQSKAEKALQGTLTDVQNQLVLRAKDIEGLEERLSFMQIQRQEWEGAAATQNTSQTQERQDFEERLSQARARVAAVELELKTQTAAYHELQDALTAARQENMTLSHMVEDQQKKMKAEANAREGAATDQKKHYEARLVALEKELNDRLKAAARDASERMTSLQARALDLERQSAEKQVSVEHLQAALAELESKRAQLETQWAKETQDHRVTQDNAAREKAQFHALEADLQKRLQEAHQALNARAADALRLESQLKEVEQERMALEQYSSASHAEHAQRLAAVQKRAAELEKALLALEQEAVQKQAAIERLQTAWDQVDAKRKHWEEQHALRVQEAQTAQKDATLEKERFVKQYAELRAALDQRALDMQALEHRLLETEQAHAALGKQAAVSLADFQKEKQLLETRAADEKVRARELDLALKTNLAQIKDLKDALFAEQKQYKASAARNEDYEQRIEEWRHRAHDLERQATEKQTALDRLRDSLLEAETKRTQAEDQKTELARRLDAAQAERKAVEDQLHAQLNDIRLKLEQRLHDESARAHDLDAKAHAQASELEQLRKAWTQETQERERLTQLLAAERERALAELKTREKTSTETTSQLWTQMEAQEKEFRFQLTSIEEESARRIGILQSRATELEKALSTQRAEFEQRLQTSQKERADAEEKLHGKIMHLEESLNRRIAEVQQLHAEFAAVESARAIAEESATSAHSELVRQQKAFDERVAQEHQALRGLEQELQGYKSQARQWKDDLADAKENNAKHQALQKQLADLERELAARDQQTKELRASAAALSTEQNRLIDQLKRAEEEKNAALERAQTVENRLEKVRHDELQTEQKMHARLADLEDQLQRKGTALTVLEDRWQKLQKSNEELEKTLNRDNASWTRQKQELEEKLISERSRLRDFEAEQISQKAALRELQETLAGAQKERQQTLDALKAQKERFLSDLAQRDSGTAQRQRALELEREALDKQWQDRLKAAAHETSERMDALKRRAEDFEKQLAARQADLGLQQDHLSALETQRQTLQEELDVFKRDRKEEANTAAAERTRLMERVRALEERLKEQNHEFTKQLGQAEETREESRGTLERRLSQLQEQVAKRTAELKNAQERLRVVEESRAQAEKEAGLGQSQLSRERAQLEERLASERGRAKDLSNRLNEVTSKMNETKEALAAAEEARQAHARDLQAQKENEKALQQRIQALERDVRASGHGKSMSANADLDAALERAQTLERDLSERDAEVERLRTQSMQGKTDFDARQSAEIEKRVAERLRDQMMNVLETGKLKSGDSSAMQTLLEEWVFGFAHQVRNPLGIIRSVAESLMEGARRQTERDSLSAIMKAVDGLNYRLREFIEFSKPVKPLMQVVDVPSAITAAVQLIEEKSKPANVAIETTLPAAGTRVWMDPDHLRTILVQLLRNAVEAMPKGGRVRVKVTYDGQQLEVRVQDEGSGISTGHMKEVGRPFFSTKPNAVGLGLALIKRLLRAYDGKMDIESRAGHATTIICRMKTKQEEAGQWAA